MKYEIRIAVLIIISIVVLSIQLNICVFAENIDIFNNISFIEGPATISIKNANARISIQKNFKFLSGTNTRNILSFLGVRAGIENISVIMSKNELISTTVFCKYKHVGYIKDLIIRESEFDKILDDIIKRNGLDKQVVKISWIKKPTLNNDETMFMYIAEIQHGNSNILDGRAVFLGRKGYFIMNLFSSDKDSAIAIDMFNYVVENFRYSSENKYSDIKKDIERTVEATFLDLSTENLFEEKNNGSFATKVFLELLQPDNSKESFKLNSRENFIILLEISALLIILKVFAGIIKIVIKKLKERNPLKDKVLKDSRRKNYEDKSMQMNEADNFINTLDEEVHIDKKEKEESNFDESFFDDTTESKYPKW